MRRVRLGALGSLVISSAIQVPKIRVAPLSVAAILFAATPVAATPAATTSAAAEPSAVPATAAPVDRPAAEPRVRMDGPVAWVRTLQLLQDRIAAGSLAAHEGQPLLIARINTDLVTAPSETWADRRNLRAAIVFALSGGGPAILQRLTARDDLVEPEATLARGALAYIEGREADANRLLKDFDTRGLPPTLAGAIALTQASLAVTGNPTGAILLLDGVRSMLPGTLAEEGALRREIFALGQLGDLKRFEALTTQYLRRFPHSVYAGNFRQRLAFQLSRFDVGRDAARFAALTRIVGELDPGSRRDLYLLIARTAIEEGKTASALLVADRALALCAPDSPDAIRGQLYRAAAEIVDLATFETGLRTLRNLDRTRLPTRDLPLLNAALATAAEIGRGLAGRRTLPAADATAPNQAAAPGHAPGEPVSLIPKAQAAVDRIDQLLQKADP